MLDQLPIGLKEWAVALKALGTGEQILIMRKGGIAEETKQFQLRGHSFYLFPTYEHQKPHLIKPDAQAMLEETLREAPAPGEPVPIRLWAEATEELLVSDSEQLAKLRDFHIWTDQFATERLKWKKLHPLHVVLLKVYKLKAPILLPMHDDYNGCKSWIELKAPMNRGQSIQVMTDQEYNDSRERIKSALTV